MVTRKPDGRIRKGSGSFIGNNVYNTTGINQTKSGSGERIDNQLRHLDPEETSGSSADIFQVVATGATVTGYTVQFFHGTTDITSSGRGGHFPDPVTRRDEDLPDNGQGRHPEYGGDGLDPYAAGDHQLGGQRREEGTL